MSASETPSTARTRIDSGVVEGRLRDLFGLTSDSPESPAPESLVPGAMVGRYRILRELGKGGMGVVLAVWDDAFGRELAAKLVPAGAAGQSVERFVMEALVLGSLEHPNIVPVHEWGRTPEGWVYYTMRRVEGRTLTELLDRDEISLPRALEVLLRVADAIAYAHSRGVLHRDLKPSNVMVGRFGEVQVMDWGLAKTRNAELGTRNERTDAVFAGGPGYTEPGTGLGTPSYMSLEQAEGRVDEIDERSDVYGLGAILYQILTREPPYVGVTGAEVMARVAAHPLVPPTLRAPWRPIPWELEAVVMRAMARSREERYPSAEAFRDEVARFLEGRTLAAATYNIRQLAARWIARHRLLVGSALSVIAIAAILAAVSFRRISASLESERTARAAAQDSQRDEERARDLAEDSAGVATRAQERAEGLLADAFVFRADRALAEKSALEAAVYVAAAREIAAGSPAVAAAGFALGPPRYAFEREFPHIVPGQVCAPFALSQDGRVLAAATTDGDEVALFDFETRLRIATFDVGDDAGAFGGKIVSIGFSGDGNRLVVVRSGTPARPFPGSGIDDPSLSSAVVLEVETGKTLHIARQGVLEAGALSPDGALLAAGGKGSREESPAVYVWSVGGDAWMPPIRTDSAVRALAFSDQAAFLGIAAADRIAYVWDVANQRELDSFDTGTNDCRALAFEGVTTVLAAGPEGRVHVWRGPDRVLAESLRAHGEPVSFVWSARDRKTRMTGSVSGAIRSWREISEDPPIAVPPGSRGVEDFAWDARGRLLAACTLRGGPGIWELAPGKDAVLVRSLDTRFAPALSADGRFAATLSEDWDLGVVALASGQPGAPLEKRDSGFATPLAFSRTGTLLASVSFGGTVAIWDVATGLLRQSIETGREHALAVALAPDLARIAIAYADGKVAIRDLATGDGVAEGGAPGDLGRVVSFSPDGRLLAVGGRGLVILDATDARLVRVLAADPEPVIDALEFSADGSLLAVGDDAGGCRILGRDTPRSLREAEARAGLVLEGFRAAPRAP